MDLALFSFFLRAQDFSLAYIYQFCSILLVLMSLTFMLKSIGFDLCIEGMVVPGFSFSLEEKRVKLKVLWEDSLC